ncbi:MAG: rhomboid family intramembrane serine protease [Kangiellaceae bacterium]|nr:rhomboid family intramembrane serine protease [Kangiellaceae bacterium]
MWVLALLNLVFDYQVNQLALIPRQPDRLFGILAMPFLHWSVPHLLANTLPLLLLGLLVCFNGKIVRVTLFITVVSGILVWFFARNGAHAGASGLIFGYFGYLLSGAYFNRSFKNIIFAITTMTVYGGLFVGLVNFEETVSFEAHIFGFIAGILSASISGRKLSKGRR